MTSDAMIHDSCFFCCEYMLTGPPPCSSWTVMLKNKASCLNEIVLAGFTSQYMGHSLEDVSCIITAQVLHQNNFKKYVLNS